MTAEAAPQRYSGASRIDDLIDEFAEAGQQCTVPLTQVELADRWNITPASVQDLLCRQQRLGRVISRSPLVLANPAHPVPLRLVTAPPQQNTKQLETITAPIPDPSSGLLLNQTLDLIISAAAVGQIDFAHQLKTLVADHLTPHIGEPNPPSVTQPATAENAERTAVRPAENAVRSRGSLEKEEEENFSSSSEEQNAGAAAVRAAGLSSAVIDVVTKRLHGRSHQSDADATFPWHRTTWKTTRPWTDDEVDDIKRFWKSANIPDALSRDAIAALQLWEPTTAARAVTSLAARSDTRNYAARIMDASIWGYHAFYPPQPGVPAPDQPLQYKRGALQEIAAHLRQFERTGLVEHLESCASRPQQLVMRAGLAYHLELLSSEELAELHFIDSPEAVMAMGTELARTLKGDQI